MEIMVTWCIRKCFNQKTLALATHHKMSVTFVQSTGHTAKTLMELMMSMLVSNAKLAKIIRKKAEETRTHNRKDRNKDADNTSIFTVGMQKIVLFPKITLKELFFVSRLVVFNETFASVKEDGLLFCSTSLSKVH